MVNSKKVILSIILVLVIIATVFGATYAFLSASASNDNAIGGSTYNGNFAVDLNTIYKADALVPVDETVVEASLATSNVCVDNSNQEICSLYELTVTNSGDAIDLLGFVRTSNSTYTTNNLTYKVYTKTGNTYTPITSATSVSNAVGDTVYFKNNNSNYTTSLIANASATYYIVFFIKNVENNNDDMGKTFDCKIGFESIYGNELSASFDASI